MVNRYSARLIFAFALAALVCASASAAEAKARPARVKLLSSTQDLIENTYIDRGRLQGVKVGDRYKIYDAEGTQVTTVIVTAIYDRMSAVKIVDSELLKDGMLAKKSGHKSYAPFSALGGRRPAPSVTISSGKKKKKAAAADAGAAASTSPTVDAGVPAPPAAPGADAGVPAPPAAPDAGVPAPPAAPDAGVPAAPALPTDGAGPAVPPPPAP